MDKIKVWCTQCKKPLGSMDQEEWDKIKDSKRVLCEGCYKEFKEFKRLNRMGEYNAQN